MIEFVSGDFFDYEADIRINTVNCVGVMGAGVALAFKKKYPNMFKAYVEVCKRKAIAPGKPFVWEEYDLFSKCTIVNLPTKIDWRNPSEYEYIEKGLIWLRDFLMMKDGEDIVTLPALGCGHGKLNWSIVKTMILHYLEGVNARILVFEPEASNRSLGEWNHSTKLKDNNIEIIYNISNLYRKKSGKIKDVELYCKGNTNLLSYSRISLICSNNIDDKEQNAIFKVLGELPKDKYVYVLGLNNKSQLELAIRLLVEGYMLILVVPYGLLHLKNDSLLKGYREISLVVSYTKPDQEFKRYEYVNSLKFRLKISDAILYCSDKLVTNDKILKYFEGYDNIFYINYWQNGVRQFEHINAIKIGVNAETKRPNVKMLLTQLQKQECQEKI